MFIGVLLVITWLVLLLRYPAKALPVSLAAVLGLAIVAASVAWLDSREAAQLARLELRIVYDPAQCPADRPLQLTLQNHNDVPLLELGWRVAAYAPGDTVNLASRLQDQTKHFACQLVLSVPAAARAGVDVSALRHEEIAVRNRDGAIGIYIVGDVLALEAPATAA